VGAARAGHFALVDEGEEMALIILEKLLHPSFIVSPFLPSPIIPHHPKVTSVLFEENMSGTGGLIIDSSDRMLYF
jgi:hypothetical protein